MRQTFYGGVRAATLILATASVFVSCDAAFAFLIADRWTATASGSTGFRGVPATLTWSLVPDGTPIPDRQPSNLVAVLDGAFGVGIGVGDLQQRPWFPFIESSFARWSALGGVTFVYEPHDDGATHQLAPGVLGVRGDVRLAAAPGDGPGGTLASSQFPDTGDIVLDSDDGLRFANPQSSYLRLRNTLMHEIGHVLGLDHISSSDAAFLMEPTLSLAFDGPQIDEVRGLHHLYGDRFERSGGGLGNDSPTLAVPLGLLSPGDELTLGVDAWPDGRVDPSAVDFLSISGRSDLDYFAFEITAPMWLDAELTPRGGRYHQRQLGQPELLIDANSSSDLALALLTANGVELALVDEQPRGIGEVLNNFFLPAAGRYLVRVAGSREVVQLYELRLAGHGQPVPEPAGAALATAWLRMAARRRRTASR